MSPYPALCPIRPATCFVYKKSPPPRWSDLGEAHAEVVDAQHGLDAGELLDEAFEKEPPPTCDEGEDEEAAAVRGGG
jgi:hypothetical protein